MTLPPLLDGLNKQGYIDDDIRCEDNTNVIREYNQIIAKYEKGFTRAVKIYEMLIKRNYMQDSDAEALGFIRGYFYFVLQSEANGK